MDIRGIDISEPALNLARDNLAHNIGLGNLGKHAVEHVSFMKADILRQDYHPDGNSEDVPPWDVVISNPPYISEAGFSRDTERSVRNWEPKLALVPPSLGDGNSAVPRAEDIFYYSILNIAQEVGSRIVLMEVGDTEQAVRVAEIAATNGQWRAIEIWLDWPDQDADGMQEIMAGTRKVLMRGSGQGRSVLCRR